MREKESSSGESGESRLLRSEKESLRRRDLCLAPGFFPSNKEDDGLFVSFKQLGMRSLHGMVQGILTMAAWCQKHKIFLGFSQLLPGYVESTRISIKQMEKMLKRMAEWLMI